MAAYSLGFGFDTPTNGSAREIDPYQEFLQLAFANVEEVRGILRAQLPESVLRHLNLSRLKAETRASIGPGLLLSGDAPLFSIPAKKVKRYGRLYIMIEMRPDMGLNVSMQFTSRRFEALLIRENNNKLPLTRRVV